MKITYNLKFHEDGESNFENIVNFTLNTEFS